MRINKYMMPATIIVILIGTVLTAKAAGYWQTSGRQMVDQNLEMTSSDIRGWMDLEYLVDGFDIPLGELRTMLGLPHDTPGHTVLKDMEDIIEVSEVRLVISEYLGEAQPEHEEGDESQVKDEDPPEPTPTPVPALTEPSHTPIQGSGEGEGIEADPTPLPAGQILPGTDIRGRMSLQEVSDQCGVPLEVLYTALDLPDSVSPNTALKDLVVQADGFEVSQMRDVVTDYQATVY